MFELDLRSRAPIYEQLVEKLKALIITEVLKKDEPLPSVRILASQLTINPNTIQKAYRELENQGYIYSVPGKGSFIAPVAPDRNAERIDRLKAELTKLLSEAMYLGMKKEELMGILSEVDITVQRRNQND